MKFMKYVVEKNDKLVETYLKYIRVANILSHYFNAKLKLIFI